MNSGDWDSSRHYDHGSSSSLNPGAPGWQNRLVSQITGLIDRYGFNGVFLDISALWVNDPNHYLYDGIMKLVQRIREGRPDVLIAGEGWYDAIGVATQLVQSGHIDALLHWHDLPYPDIFDKYNRSLGHLFLGDPGRGSTTIPRKAPVVILHCARNAMVSVPDCRNCFHCNIFKNRHIVAIIPHLKAQPALFLETRHYVIDSQWT